MLTTHPNKNVDIKVLFSHDIFFIQEMGGVVRGFCELSSNLHDMYGNCAVYSGEYCGNMADNLNLYLGDRMEGQKVARLSGRINSNIRGEIGLKRCIDQLQPSVVHRTQYNVVDLSPSELGVVSTLHDTWTERRSGRTSADRIRSLFKRRALEKSDVIICVSENTKDELSLIWPHLCDRARVVYHGSRRISANPIAPTGSVPYFLYVGSRELRKNFPILIEVFAKSERLKGVNLICVGPPFSENENILINKYNLHHRIVRRPASDDQLAGLYESAIALLYPSRFEGFGMPLLEAMHHSCPVISSPATCLSEIGGSAALYADPDSLDEWVMHMEALVFDEEVSMSLREKGLARARSFSWARCADEHQEIYQQFYR